MRKSPGQVRFNLTPAIKRALHMVNNGHVIMQSDVATGRTFSVAKGKATSRMLWMLVGNRLIERASDGRMQLTRAGLALLGGRASDGASRVQAGNNGFPSASKSARGPVRR